MNVTLRIFDTFLQQDPISHSTIFQMMVQIVLLTAGAIQKLEASP